MIGGLAIIRDFVISHELVALAIAFGIGNIAGMALYILARLIGSRVQQRMTKQDTGPRHGVGHGIAPEDLALGQLAIIRWRLNRRVDKMQAQLAGQARALAGHVKTIGDYARDIDAQLRKLGVVVFDPVGMPYDPGLDVEVISREPRPDLDCEKMVETVSPSVSRHNRPLARAAVVVGHPATAAQQDDTNARY